MEKIFVHEGSGQFIGSKVMVIAKTEKKAKSLIKETLDANGLKQEIVKITEIIPIKNNSVIHIDNGDY